MKNCVLWVMTPWNLSGRNVPIFERILRPHHLVGGGSWFLGNVDTQPPDHMSSKPRRQILRLYVFLDVRVCSRAKIYVLSSYFCVPSAWMCVCLFTPDMIESVHSVEIRFVISKVDNVLALCLLMDRYTLKSVYSKKLLLYLHRIIT
jgi:hypothetical protein